VDARGRGSREAYEQALEYLCRYFGDLDEQIGTEAWKQSLDAARAAEPDTDEWRRAIRELHGIAERAGIPGGLGLTTPMGAQTWPPGRPPRPTGWVCPTEVCSRVELSMGAQSAGAAPARVKPSPRCVLLDRPMRFVGD